MSAYLHNFSLKKKKKKGSVARSNNIIILLSRSFPKTNKTKQMQNQKRNNSSGKMLGKVCKPGVCWHAPCPLTDRIQNRTSIHRYFIFVLEEEHCTCSNKELIFSVSIIIFSLSGFPLANSCGGIMKAHDISTCKRKISAVVNEKWLLSICPVI